MSKIICVDAGHGGKDPGACSNGVQEKDIALKIALKVKGLLLANDLGVVMTRESDQYDSVNEKARKANLAKADLFVSIHCNSASQLSANGTETLSYDLTGKSFQLASCIQQELTNICQRRNRGVKQRKDLAVLNSTQMPAILVETAFISNEEERKLLQQEAFQNKIAMAIVKGICQYYGIKLKEKYKVPETKVSEWKETSVKLALEKGILNQYHNPLEPVDMGTLCTMLLAVVQKKHNK